MYNKLKLNEKNYLINVSVSSIKKAFVVIIRYLVRLTELNDRKYTVQLKQDVDKEWGHTERKHLFLSILNIYIKSLHY